MEAGTGLAILGSALGGAKLVEKLLGPTAEYIGDGIQKWAEKRVKNVQRIFSKATEKLGGRINEPGLVPARVLKEVISEGSFCDDPLTTEYFGGVLASSRSPIARDDRGASWSSLIARLSSYQVRCHYLMYSSLYDKFHGQDVDLTESSDREKASLFLPFSAFMASMEFRGEELGRLDMLLAHTIFGLDAEGLIQSFIYGEPDLVRKQLKLPSPPSEGGIYFWPSARGSELYLWVHGYGHLNLQSSLHLDIPVLEGITLCDPVMSRDDLTDSKSVG